MITYQLILTLSALEILLWILVIKHNYKVFVFYMLGILGMPYMILSLF